MSKYEDDIAHCREFLRNADLLQTPQGRVQLIEWCMNSSAPQKRKNFWGEKVRQALDKEAA